MATPKKKPEVEVEETPIETPAAINPNVPGEARETLSVGQVGGSFADRSKARETREKRIGSAENKAVGAGDKEPETK